MVIYSMKDFNVTRERLSKKWDLPKPGLVRRWLRMIALPEDKLTKPQTHIVSRSTNSTKSFWEHYIRPLHYNSETIIETAGLVPHCSYEKEFENDWDKYFTSILKKVQEEPAFKIVIQNKTSTNPAKNFKCQTGASIRNLLSQEQNLPQQRPVSKNICFAHNEGTYEQDLKTRNLNFSMNISSDSKQHNRTCQILGNSKTTDSFADKKFLTTRLVSMHSPTSKNEHSLHSCLDMDSIGAARLKNLNVVGNRESPPFGQDIEIGRESSTLEQHSPSTSSYPASLQLSTTGRVSVSDLISCDTYDIPNTTGRHSLASLAAGDAIETERLIGGESHLDNIKDKFITVLDHLDTRVGKLRKSSKSLIKKQDSLLTCVDLLQADDGISTLPKKDYYRIVCFLERLNTRLSTIHLNVPTIRDLAQEKSIADVNKQIDAIIAMQDPQSACQRCQLFLNSCNGSRPIGVGVESEMEGPIDTKFESLLLGCTLDDQSHVRERLKALLVYMNAKKQLNA